MSNKIYHPESVEEFNKLLKSHACIVDFYTTWCGPCKSIGMYLENITKVNRYPNVTFIKIDAENPVFADICTDISSVPTLKFYKKGVLQEKLTMMGSNKKRLDDTLEELNKV
jgi:thioredoxin 1